MEEVLVVGAGPVGLTMAAELARHGRRCRIIDRLDRPSGYCKAIGVTPRTLEVWEDMGVARPMIDAGLWISGLRTIIAGGAPLDVVPDLSDLPYGQLGIPQYATERILAEHLARLGIVVERGVALEDLRDDGSRVTADLRHEGGRGESAEFRFVVGCDGAHSAVRRSLGIGFQGDSFPMDFMLGDVAIDWDAPRGLAVFAVKPRENAAPDFLVVIPLPDRNRYRVSMLAGDELDPPSSETEAHGISSERPGPSLDQLQAVSDRLLPDKPRLSDLRWSSLFRISMRLADRYRVGNAFIAGDAAHIHPPTGGQGMNTGIQDAYNLAWKMALVLKGAASERLLDSYEGERRAVGAEVVARTAAASMSFGRERSQPDRLENTQILVNYRDSDIVDNQDAPHCAIRAGDRAPDAAGLRRAQLGFPFRLFDVLRGTEHVLVTYIAGARPADQAATLETIACDLTRQYGGLIRVMAVARADADLPEPIAYTLLRDPEGTFGRAYDAVRGMTMLVRPDGYVGLLCSSPDKGAIQSYMQRVFG